MISKLPKWYQILSIQDINQETLEQRSKAITAIAQKKDTVWLLECVRYYLNKPANADFEQQLEKAIVEIDPMFVGRPQELRVLAGVIVHQTVVNNISEKGVAIASAAKSCAFRVDTGSLINADILAEMIQYLQDKSIAVRESEDFKKMAVPIIAIPPSEMTPDALKNYATEVNQKLKSIADAINKVIEVSFSKIRTLEEESNIQWWIFKGISTTQDMPFGKLDPLIAPVIIAQELETLTTLIPAPVAAEQFLKKVWLDSFKGKEKTMKFSDCVNQIVTKNATLSEHYTLGNICPFYLACQTAVASGDKTSWESGFYKATGINPSFELSALDLAYQVYNESMAMQAI